MIEEKTELKQILRRLDELLRILRFLSEDLTDISKILRTNLSLLSAGEQKTTATEQSPFSPDEGSSRTIDDVQKIFPQDLSRMLYFEMTGEYVLIKPRQYLGSEIFARIAAIVRDQLNGEYVSQGRESHFRIARQSQLNET